MEIFKIADYIRKENPKPGERISRQILEKKAKGLTGIFGLLPPGGQTAYHYHEKRESVMVIISGRAKEVVEGKPTAIEKDDILFIPAKQKHGMKNDSGEEIRYIEFQTGDPEEMDIVHLDWPEV
jgi:mannose-6-phosphate isomerase-like protein (cupin superfamily)